MKDQRHLLDQALGLQPQPYLEAQLAASLEQLRLD